MKFYLLLLGILLSFSVYTQNIIFGKVYSENGEVLENVNVVLIDDDKISTFDISSYDGSYKLDVLSDQDSVTVKVFSINHATDSMKIANKSAQVDFFLKHKIIKLKEVVVKPKAISRYGDTLSYSVSSFKSKNDVKLIETLERMPGINIQSDGKITYLGEAIQKFYIDGLDMLEGRYNLVTKNISVNSVESVEVLENHQPVKILESYGNDKASLNIKLKKDYTFSGSAEAGLGAIPLLRKVNITPMLFSPNKQFIFSAQSNNTGEDLKSQNEVLTIDDLLEKSELNLEKEEWVSLQKVSVPYFNRDRFIFNNSNMFSIAQLTKLNDDMQLKFNSSFYNDISINKGGKETSYLLNGDTLNIEESFTNNIKNNNLKSEMLIENNSKSLYLKNKTNIEAYWDSQNGVLENNNVLLEEIVSSPYFLANNYLRMLKPIANNILNLNSSFIYIQTPQSLIVNENSDNYQVQNVSFNEFRTNTVTGIGLTFNNIITSYKIGLSTSNSDLKSKLERAIAIDSSRNNFVKRSSVKTYLKLSANYNNDRIRLSTNLEPFLYNYSVNNVENRKTNSFNWNGKISFAIDISSRWRFSSTVQRKSIIGEQHFYNNPILKNYRTLTSNDVDFALRTSNNFSTGFRYRNSVKGLFTSIYYSYNLKENNSTISSSIDNEAFVFLERIENQNTSGSHNISLELSKFFANLNGNINLRSIASKFNNQQLINSKVSNIINSTLRTGVDISSLLISWMDIKVNSDLLMVKTDVNNVSSAGFIQHNHGINVKIYPLDRHVALFANEFYIRDQKLTAFLDFKYLLKFNESASFEAGIKNILNNNYFNNYSVSNFEIVESFYKLRPRQVLFSFKYTF